MIGRYHGAFAVAISLLNPSRRTYVDDPDYGAIPQHDPDRFTEGSQQLRASEMPAGRHGGDRSADRDGTVAVRIAAGAGGSRGGDTAGYDHALEAGELEDRNGDRPLFVTAGDRHRCDRKFQHRVQHRGERGYRRDAGGVVGTGGWQGVREHRTRL